MNMSRPRATSSTSSSCFSDLFEGTERGTRLSTESLMTHSSHPALHTYLLVLNETVSQEVCVSRLTDAARSSSSSRSAVRSSLTEASQKRFQGVI